MRSFTFTYNDQTVTVEARTLWEACQAAGSALASK